MMNAWDVIICVLLAVIVVAAIVAIVRNKKSGGCCGDCSKCDKNVAGASEREKCKADVSDNK